MNRFRMALWLAFGTIASCATGVNGQHLERVRYDDHKLARVTLRSREDIETILRISEDPWSDRVEIGSLPFRVAPEHMPALRESGLAFEILHENVQTLIDQQRPARAPAGWFEDFKTYEEVNALIDTLAALRPDLVTKLTIGQSLEGRTIYGMRISGLDESADAPAVLFNSTQHAREWITPMTTMYIADRLVGTYDVDPDVQAMVDQVVFYIVPIVNPDGYVYAWDVERLWRKNRRDNGNGCYGVDNNRNWGFNWGDDTTSSSDPCNQIYRGTGPFSEPENQAVRDFVLAHSDIVAHIDFHSYTQVLISPYGDVSGEPPEPDRTTFRELNPAMAAAIFNVHGVTYTYGPSSSYLSGGFPCWTHADLGILSWTFELRDTGEYGFLLPADQILPTAEENFAAITVLAHTLYEFAFVFPDGLPGYIEPETQTTVRVDIRDIGNVIAPGTVCVLARVGSAGAFTASMLTSTGGSSYEATLPAAPCGSIIEYYLQAESAFGGPTTAPDDAPASVYTANVIDTEPWMDDDMEAETGWIAGAPDDDATTGVWVRVDPNGTEAQPEDDHTLSGTLCWVTGQGTPGGELGENDVDGGKTTLLSPVYDLAGEDAAVSYWRWYSNDTGASPNADVFLVDVSFDGGAVWANVETVGPTGPDTGGGWIYHEFRVSDFGVPTSQVRFRFVASDEGDGSLVEAAVDDLVIRRLTCGPQVFRVEAEGCRYLAITPPDGTQPVALRLTSPDYPCLLQYVNHEGRLVDTPVLRLPGEWTTAHAHGREIVPDTAYLVRVEFGDQTSVDETTVTTGLWGDIVGPFAFGQWAPPDGSVDIIDAVAGVDRFRNLPYAPPMEVCDLQPEIPDGNLDILEVSYILDAFRGLPYPFSGPCP
jgi:murein tripeptide amidase MpaA